MKTFLLAFLISFTTYAATVSPGGMYQIDQVHSKIVSFEKSTSIKGHIDLAESFEESKLIIDSKDMTFESSEFTGTLEDFEVTGILSAHGKSNKVTLKGKYFGTINNELGKKAAFNFYNQDLNLKVFASRHSDSTAALFKEVQEIVE